MEDLKKKVLLKTLLNSFEWSLPDVFLRRRFHPPNHQNNKRSTND
jgi:hypothetical protein